MPKNTINTVQYIMHFCDSSILEWWFCYSRNVLLFMIHFKQWRWNDFKSGWASPGKSWRSVVISKTKTKESNAKSGWATGPHGSTTTDLKNLCNIVLAKFCEIYFIIFYSASTHVLYKPLFSRTVYFRVFGVGAVIREWLISRFIWCCHYYK